MEYAISIIAWFFAGLVNGITGFGAAMVAMPFISRYIEIPIAVPATTLLVLSLNLQVIFTLEKNIDFKRIQTLIVGLIPGSFFGVFLLQTLPESALKIILGSFIMLYSVWAFFFETKTMRVISRHWGYLVGLISGFFGTSFGINGPPLIIYAALSGWDKDRVKSGLATFFVTSGIIVILAQASGGLFNKQSFLLYLASLPAVVLGLFIGLRISKNMKNTSYRRLIFIVLFIMGFGVFEKGF